MIKWFQNRTRKKKVAELEGELVSKLAVLQPKMCGVYSNAHLSAASCQSTPVPHIKLTHFINGPYFEKNKSKHREMYSLSGIEIKELNSDAYSELKLEVTRDLISKIIIKNPENFWVHFDICNIRLTNLVKNDVRVIENEDEKKLRSLLDKVESENLNKIEIEDCFEIELEGKRFLTILDMEDGNCIAVNSRGQVFRLNHDSDNPVKMIQESIEEFLKGFSGNKEDLEKHFDR